MGSVVAGELASLSSDSPTTSGWRAIAFRVLPREERWATATELLGDLDVRLSSAESNAAGETDSRNGTNKESFISS